MEPVYDIGQLPHSQIPSSCCPPLCTSQPIFVDSWVCQGGCEAHEAPWAGHPCWMYSLYSAYWHRVWSLSSLLQVIDAHLWPARERRVIRLCVSKLSTDCTFNKDVQLRELHVPHSLLDKLRSQQILAGKCREEGSMRKEFVNGEAGQCHTQAPWGKFPSACGFLKQIPKGWLWKGQRDEARWLKSWLFNRELLRYV